MRLRVALLVVVLSACTPGGHSRVTVVNLVAIPTPDNLADDAECVELWGNISSYGLEMDRARNDWNQIVISSAALLIERGCVRQAVR